MLKKRKRYVIPASARDDARGVDFWIKMRGTTTLVPVQVTQRGTALFRKHHQHTGLMESEIEAQGARRLRWKRMICSLNSISLVLIRDFDGARPSQAIAWGDVKALRYSLAQT